MPTTSVKTEIEVTLAGYLSGWMAKAPTEASVRARLIRGLVARIGHTATEEWVGRREKYWASEIPWIVEQHNPYFPELTTDNITMEVASIVNLHQIEMGN